MTCWRCGVSLEPLGYHEETDEYELPAHKPWCSMPGGCSHCGWSPCRWWCLGEDASGLGLWVDGTHLESFLVGADA